METNNLTDHSLSTREEELTGDMLKVVEILKKVPEFRNEADLRNLLPLLLNIKFFKEKKIKQRDLVEIC